MTPILAARDLSNTFHAGGSRRRRQSIRAVETVSFELAPGRTLGLVGESGCGKSTLGRLMVGLLTPSSGHVEVDGQRAEPGDRARAAAVQMVFQDPHAALNPRRTIAWSLEAPLAALSKLDAAARRERARTTLERVGLGANLLNRYPHELSGGQAQRVGIARALAVQPKVLVLDEAVAALDVSVRLGVLDLLGELQTELGVAYLFISHDFSVMRLLAHDVAVMYLGRIVEVGSREQILDSPVHPYTRVLLSSVPSIASHERRIPLAGEPPSAARVPPGCAFHPRCYRAEPRCGQETPALEPRDGGHPTACHFAPDTDPDTHQVRGPRLPRVD